MSRTEGNDPSPVRSVRVFSGDVRASLLRPHQVLIAREDATAILVQATALLRLNVHENESPHSCLLEIVVDRRATKAGGLAAGCVQVHPWVCDAMGFSEGRVTSIRTVRVTHKLHSLLVVVVDRSPRAVRISSTPTHEPQRNDSAAATAALLPESIRSGLVHLHEAIQRQVQAMYQARTVAPRDLLPVQLMGETFVFRVVDAVYNDQATEDDDDVDRLAVNVLGVTTAESRPPTTHDEDSLLATLDRLHVDDDRVASRLSAAGFAGYMPFLHDVLFHVLLNFASSAQRHALVCHGVLITGVPGVGKSLALRVIHEELQYRGVGSVWRIDGMSLLMEFDNARTASAYDFLLDRFEQFIPGFTRERRAAGVHQAVGVVLVDDIEVLFQPTGAQEASEDGGTGSLSPLGSALLRFLDSLPDPNSRTKGPRRLCIIGTTSYGGDDAAGGDEDSSVGISSIAKRSGRFDKQIELIVPTEAMRREILTHHLSALPLQDPVTRVASALAELTGGYVAKDLVRICRLAFLQAHTVRPANHEATPVVMTWDQLLTAQRQIKPSQLRQLNVASPSMDKDFVSPFAGYVELQKQLTDFITWKFQPSEAIKHLGVANASGLLIHGPSGCGKSLLVKTLAARAKVNFVSVKSSELLSKYFGDSERAVRQLFARARAAAPCLLFFDEFDAIAHKRSFGGGDANAGDGTGVYARILSTFLNEMDGVGAARNRTADVLVVAATNRLDALDAALIRPGRIDKCVELAFPQREDCQAVLEHYTRTMPLAADVNLATLAGHFARTPSFSGADIAAVCKEAALRALRASDLNADSVGLSHLLAAFHQRIVSRQ